MLSGKLALVTGAGSGIGRCVSETFAKQGATVVLTDLKKKDIVDACSSLPKSYDQDHQAVHCDVSGGEFVRQLREFVLGHYKRAPDVLVNSAGITMDGWLHRMSEEQFDWVISVNLKGTFLVTRDFSESMVEQGIKGSIINIASIIGKIGNLGQANYAASKSGVIGLTKTVARELGPKGIRCNAVLPGFIKTPMTDKVPDKVLKYLLKEIPLQRIGEPSDIADVCKFLASEDSRYINGACLEVTGGLGM